MKKILIGLALLSSLYSFADDRQVLEIGCVARLYCAPVDYTEMDKILVSRLGFYGDPASIDKQCEKLIFSNYRGDSDYTKMRLYDAVDDFPGYLCFESRVPEIISDFK